MWPFFTWRIQVTDTLGNIKLVANTWTDLYAATEIAVGTQIIVQNIGVCDVSLSSQLAKPSNEEATQIVQRGDWVINDKGDAGAWAYCQASSAMLNVRAS